MHEKSLRDYCILNLPILLSVYFHGTLVYQIIRNFNEYSYYYWKNNPIKNVSFLKNSATIEIELVFDNERAS